MEGSLRSDMAGTGVGPDDATTTQRLTSERNETTNCIVIRNVCVTPEERRKMPPLHPSTDLDFIKRSKIEQDKVDRLNYVVATRTDYVNKSKLFAPLPNEDVYEPKSNDFVPLNFTHSRAYTDDFVAATAFKGNHTQITPKPIHKRKSSKAQNILGYLKRKSSAIQNYLEDPKTSLMTVKPGKPEESPYKEYHNESTTAIHQAADAITNRFNALQDTLAETPDDEDDEEDEIMTVEGNVVGTNPRADGALAQPAPPPNPEEETSWHDIVRPSFSKARVLRDKKTRKVYTALTYHLKCKHFMHSRDPHFIRTLVQDARAWMTRQKLPTESHIEYAVLTSAVAAAFFIDQEELDFRARMKNRTEWQAIEKINKAMTGDLGHRLFPVKPMLKGVRHVFQSHVRFPPTNIASV